MSILDLSNLDLDNVSELHILPADSEVKLRITDITSGVGQSGLTWWRLSLIPVDDDLAKEIREFITIPDASIQEPRKFAGSVQRFKIFLSAFAIPFNAVLADESELIGREAWATLGQKENEGYGLENTVKRWMAQR